MSFSLMPIELNYHTVSFIQPAKVTSAEIKICARQLVNISLVNKEFNQICSEKLTTLKKINDLVNKYSKYNSDYENPGEDWRTGRELDPKGNPQLLDALFTGCRFPFAGSTFKDYTPEIEQDIKDIVRLTPQSMNCILGTLKCRDDVPPLFAACINKNIPLHIVEFLLQQGANPKATLKLNGRPINILADLEGGVDAERVVAIKALFSKYGAV
jgi:hypothetical protein